MRLMRGFRKSSNEKANKKPCNYILSHGSGGFYARKWIEPQDGYHMAIEGVDISITGHTHKPTKTPSARLMFDSRNNNVIKSNTEFSFVLHGSIMRAIPERAQMRPTAFYPDTIRLDGTKKAWA